MRFPIGAVLIGVGLLSGCGGSEEYRYASETETPEAAYANEVYTRLIEMKRANRAEGPESLDVVGYLEGIEGYGESPPVGQHAATYDEIHAGVRELQDMLNSGNPSRAAVDKKLDELLAKAEQLPHTAGNQAADAAAEQQAD